MDNRMSSCLIFPRESFAFVLFKAMLLTKIGNYVLLVISIILILKEFNSLDLVQCGPAMFFQRKLSGD